jgi:DNA polymerase-3 subunit beta
VTTDKDEVEDEIEISYDGPVIEIGFNASYLIEYLNIVKSDRIRASFTDPDHVVLFEALSEVQSPHIGQHSYVVMPMRL